MSNTPPPPAHNYTKYFYNFLMFDILHKFFYKFLYIFVHFTQIAKIFQLTHLWKNFLHNAQKFPQNLTQFCTTYTTAKNITTNVCESNILHITQKHARFTPDICGICRIVIFTKNIQNNQNQPQNFVHFDEDKSGIMRELKH